MVALRGDHAMKGEIMSRILVALLISITLGACGQVAAPQPSRSIPPEVKSTPSVIAKAFPSFRPGERETHVLEVTGIVYIRYECHDGVLDVTPFEVMEMTPIAAKIEHVGSISKGEWSYLTVSNPCREGRDIVFGWVWYDGEKVIFHIWPEPEKRKRGPSV